MVLDRSHVVFHGLRGHKGQFAWNIKHEQWAQYRFKYAYMYVQIVHKRIHTYTDM